MKKGEKQFQSGWRTIGGQKCYFRSKWEANYARYLEFLKEYKKIKEWEHEPDTFWFESIKRGVRSYLPDFKVTQNDDSIYYVEVKGYMDSKSATKLKRMKKYYPEIEVRLVDGDNYKVLVKQLRYLVKDWE